MPQLLESLDKSQGVSILSFDIYRRGSKDTIVFLSSQVVVLCRVHLPYVRADAAASLG